MKFIWIYIDNILDITTLWTVTQNKILDDISKIIWGFKKNNNPSIFICMYRQNSNLYEKMRTFFVYITSSKYIKHMIEVCNILIDRGSIAKVS